MTEERLAERREYKRKWRIANRDKIHNYNQRQREKKIAAGLITPRLKEEDTLTEEQKKASDEVCADLKTPRELKEEFDKLCDEEKKAIYKGYEALGMEVVKQNGKEFREWCHIYYSTQDVAKKRNAELNMARLRRWFRGDLHNWMVTDMTGDEWCDKIERIAREEAKRRRK